MHIYQSEGGGPNGLFHPGVRWTGSSVRTVRTLFVCLFVRGCVAEGRKKMDETKYITKHTPRQKLHRNTHTTHFIIFLQDQIMSENIKKIEEVRVLARTIVVYLKRPSGDVHFFGISRKTRTAAKVTSQNAHYGFHYFFLRSNYD